MKKIFWIDGGAGRAIAAIPALLKYARLNPNEDWAVLVAAWDFLYWGIPELQDRTYGIDTKGLFDNVVKNLNIIYETVRYEHAVSDLTLLLHRRLNTNIKIKKQIIGNPWDMIENSDELREIIQKVIDGTKIY